MSFPSTLLMVTTLFNALMAGLFYSFNMAVLPGLGKLSDPQFIRSMQAINKAIRKPVFAVVSVGILLLLPFTAIINYDAQPMIRTWLLVLATVVYFSGVLVITVAGNHGLDETLEKLDTSITPHDVLKLYRQHFERKWKTLNWVRILAATVSLLLLLLVCINPFSSTPA